MLSLKGIRYLSDLANKIYDIHLRLLFPQGFFANNQMQVMRDESGV